MTYERYIRILTAAGGASLVGAAVGGVGVGFWLAFPFGGAAIPVVLAGFFIGIPIALLHAWLLGVPAYLILEKLSGPPGRTGTATGGLAVGTVPFTLLIVRTAPTEGVDAGLSQLGLMIALFAVSGLAGGLAFHRLIIDPDDEPAV